MAVLGVSKAAEKRSVVKKTARAKLGEQDLSGSKERYVWARLALVGAERERMYIVFSFMGQNEQRARAMATPVALCGSLCLIPYAAKV